MATRTRRPGIGSRRLGQADIGLHYACAVLRRLLRDSAIYGAAGLFSQGIAFLLFPFLAHKLDPHAYGVVDIVGVLTTLALLTVALEINQGLGRAVALRGEPEDRTAYASTALLWSVASYTVFAIVALALAKPLTTVLLGQHVDVWVTRTAIVGIWVAGALYLLQDQLRWRARPRAFATVSAVVAVATTGSIAIYVFVLGGKALGVVAGQLTGAAFGLVTALALSRGMYRLRFEWSKARAMLVFSIPLVPSSIGVLLNGYADRLAIQHQQSLAGVGVYGVAFRIVVVVTLLLLGVQNALTPHVVSRHSEPQTRLDLARMFRLFWALGCVTFIFLSILAEPLVRLLAAPIYFGAARVVPFLVAAAFLAGLYVFAPGPMITGRTRVYAAANVIAGLLNLGLAFALVPSLGIRGAGVATVVSSLFAFVATMGISQRLYPVPHNWLRIGAGASAAVLSVVAARSLLVTSRADALNAGPLVARLGICVIGTLLVLAVLIDGAELRSLNLRARSVRA